MFSSTAQILEAYLEASPLSSATGSMRWTPSSATIMEAKLVDAKASNIRTYFDLASATTSPRTSLSDASPAASPASSHTAYSSETSSPKKAGSLEIRRRRLPQGTEPRVKNLSLTKSNGATNTQPAVKEVKPTSASSDYNRSPPMDSPAHLPPHIPPKSLARPAPQNSIEQKPIQLDQEKQWRNADLPNSSTTLSSAKFQAQTMPITKQPNLSTRLISLSKANPPAAGMRPKGNHQKTPSIASNKELPPNPPVEKSFLPQSDIIIGMSLSPPPEEREMLLPSTQYSQGKSKPSTGFTGLPSGPKGLPSGPKARTNIAVSRRPVPTGAISEEAHKKAVESNTVRPLPTEPAREMSPPRAVQKGLSRPGPALGSLSSGPSLRSRHQANASISSLTSATVSGPISLPDFQVHQRRESEDSQLSPRSHSRNESKAQTAGEMITIGIEAPRPRPSQDSLRSGSSSNVSRSTTPQSHRSASTAATSISSLPDVPEVRSPIVAPEIKPSHFNCYSSHRPLVASSNKQAPILCMACKEDSEEMWGCGWCHLRVCLGCKEALVEVGNDLRKMLDESAAGGLVIGKKRVPPPPFLYSNEPRDYNIETTSIRSNGSSGARLGPPREYANETMSVRSNGSSGSRLAPPRDYNSETMSVRSNGSAGARPGLPRQYSSETMSIRSNGSAGARSGPPRVQGPNYGPQQRPYIRQQRSMDSLQPRGPPRGPPYRPNGAPIPPPNRRGPPPPQQMRGGGPMDFIGMPPPPSMMNKQRPPPPSQNPYGQPNFQSNPYNNYRPPPPPSQQQQQNNFQPRPYPPQPPPNRRQGPGNSRPRLPPPSKRDFNDDDDGFMPPMVDLSLGAGEGPMAAGMRSYKQRGGVAKPIDQLLGLSSGPGMMGAYPSIR